MLPKKNRADKKTLETVFKAGKSISSANLVFKFLLAKECTFPSVSFIVPKNVASRAVARNTLRRRGYNALAKLLPEFPAGLAGAFIFKNMIDSVPKVEEEIKIILNKLKK